MADPLWTAQEIARATGGQVQGDFAVQGVSIDTRSVEPGDLFVALSGVRDGHDFVAQALAAGASGALVSHAVDGPWVQVADTLRGLEDLGMAARDRAPQALRGAVTGSVGKTSVTQAIAAGLALAGPSHTSVKSYNNHIGVPLTLARMPRATRRAIFEIGMNHPGEIVPLSQMVQPHAAVVTTVGPVHVENFPDGEAGVVRAKAEIFEGMAAGGIAVLNADNAWFETLRDAALGRGLQVHSFGRQADCRAQLVDFQVEAGLARVKARFEGRELAFSLRQTGGHWGLNAMAVLLMLEALKVETATGLAALEAFEPLAGRGAERRVGGPAGDFTLIDESYNANPISMSATIGSLGARKTSGRRLVVLTDMLELGEAAASYHADLAPLLDAAGIDRVYCAGPLMKFLWEALPSTRRGGYAEQAADLAPQVARDLEPGDLVMVKGSNGSRAGVVVTALLALDPGSGGRV